MRRLEIKPGQLRLEAWGDTGMAVSGAGGVALRKVLRKWESDCLSGN